MKMKRYKNYEYMELNFIAYILQMIKGWLNG
ncbi:hypothetical protein IX317_002144 [Fusobacterium sp. DD29]|nr:hypothetical protein [Fusobacterium sp. DD29]MBR8762663.1 hypothetical protein [Fusobacterium sp. DD25]MBR8768680.1 hypothetical protein [Fusobacterium sp. DD43]MBR8772753.1 hypothetical protein [Fusobacterium sp. DD40]MBR8776962.1 hypothetical protein [Fusobacterium sp. DD17]MBR8799238.1 hypothetical protein [Fusobacterium sp. DD12]MBR8801434.1 hypothetical protein [Fusobacterium sp. DD10]MBR8805715.1 hypothetical protein [Fusobacterium sp. DD13]MBR8812878.1 hypothetical protein [Fusoba